MSDFKQIAMAPNYCASTECKADCDANPACQYYSTENGNDILFKRSDNGGNGGNGGNGNGNGPPPPTPQPPAFDLVNSINELQDLENYLFGMLEEVNMSDEHSIDEQNKIIAQINNLSDLRNNLFGQLGKIYINLDKNSQIERSALTDQIVTTNMMERQLNNLKSDVSIILDQRTDKMRMVEIGEYEYLRYSAHTSAMKILAFYEYGYFSMFSIIEKKILPTIFPRIGIMAACAIGGVLLVKQVWGMATRDNQNYNRFTQPDADADYTGKGDTVWEHDKNFFYQLLHGAEADYRKGWGDLKHEIGILQHDLDQVVGLANKNAFCASHFTPARKYDVQTNNCVPLDGAPNGNGPEGFQVERAFKEGDKLDGAPFN